MLQRSILRRLLFLFALCASVLQSNAQELYMYHFYVGNGDATLIVTYFPSRNPADPGANVKKTVLIDGGYINRSVAVRNYIINTLHINRINYMVASHYDADHVNGLAGILRFCLQSNQLTVDTIYDRGEVLYNVKSRGVLYKKQVTEYIKQRPNSKRITVQPGLNLTLWRDADPRFNITMQCICVNALVYNNANGSTIDINTNPKVNTLDENDLCTGFLVSYGKFRYLTCGDIGGFKTGNYRDIETSVIGVVRGVSAYKVNHHGSENSTNKDWVGFARAGVAIISAGPKGNFAHPRAEVAGSLSFEAARTKRNGIANGRLNIVYDVRDENNMQNYYLTYSINKFDRSFGPETNGILNPDTTQPIILKVTKTFAFPPGGVAQSDISKNCAYMVMNNWYYFQNNRWNRQLNP